MEALAQARVLHARNADEASVRLVGVFQGEPESVTETGSVCRKVASWWAVHLAADPRRLEDHHRLNEPGILQAQAPREVRELRIAGEAVEDGIEIVHGVPDLVHGRVLVLRQAPGFVEGALLEEEADLVAGFLK